jgi:uncharacterized cupin superfamily protein
MTFCQTPRSRWSSLQFTEHVLAESARRALTLSAARQAMVLAALLAEAARLRAAQLRRMRRHAEIRRAIARLSLPVLALSGLLVACLSACVAYLLVGGARAPTDAHLSGRAAIGEMRRAPTGLTWSVARPPETWQDHALHHGDEVLAITPVTLTFANGWQATAMPGSRLRMLFDGNGLALLHGEVAAFIANSNGDADELRIETTAGSITAQGTRFRVRVESDLSVSAFVDEGRVTVTNDAGAVANVSVGEQVRLRAGAPLKVELQVPRVTFRTYAKDRVISNSPHVPFSARILPRATLIVEEALSGRQFARYIADADGVVEGTLPAIEGSVVLRFSQAAPDGRASAPSQPVEIAIDRQAPMLAVTRALRDGNKVQVAGQTEIGAQVWVNDVRVTPGADGFFSFEGDALWDAASVVVTAIDAAGNATRIVQTLDR